LANEYADYFTTPEEYDAQHYEGAATIYGRTSSLALQDVLTELAGDLVSGKPAPAPYSYDPVNGIGGDAGAAPFPTGATSATVNIQPAPTAERLGHPSFTWQGGQRGYDRPLDRAFVEIQRQTGGGWTTVDSDLGLNMLWTVNEHGVYYAHWEAPLTEQTGTYRFAVHANRYELTSEPFKLGPSTALSVKRVSAGLGKVAISLAYPSPIHHDAVGDPPGDFQASLTARPEHADSGKVTFLVDGKPKTVTAGQNGTFTVSAAPGSKIEVKPGAARDQYGNTNGSVLVFTS
jgi:hypothetical protein